MIPSRSARSTGLIAKSFVANALELSGDNVRFSVQRDLESFRGVAGPRSLDAEIGHVDVRRVREFQAPWMNHAFSSFGAVYVPVTVS